MKQVNFQPFRSSSMGGWIKVPRSIIQWNWYDDIITKSVFLHLLLLANHTDVKWRAINIRRGQLVTSYVHLSQTLHIPMQQVKTAIKHLKSTNEITTKSTNKYTLITICQYDSYQNVDERTNLQTNQQNDSQVTFNQLATNFQLTTNKNSNNENKNKELKKSENSVTPTLSLIQEYWKEKNFYKSDPKDFFKYYSQQFPVNWQYYADKWEEREKEKICVQKENSGLPHKKIDYSQANLTF